MIFFVKLGLPLEGEGFDDPGFRQAGVRAEINARGGKELDLLQPEPALDDHFSCFERRIWLLFIHRHTAEKADRHKSRPVRALSVSQGALSSQGMR